MLVRYVSDEERKLDALNIFAVRTKRSQSETASDLEAVIERRVVDAGRIELPTSALRTQRSPS